MQEPAPLEIPLYYDFASSLCYVAHRVMERLAPFLGEIGCVLAWQPVDLARLLGWPRDFEVPEARLEHVQAVARELGVPLRPQPRWQDSRRANAAAILLGERDRANGSCREPTFRERLFSLMHEEGRPCDEPGVLPAITRELGIEIAATEWEQALDRLESRTLEARDRGVPGVPTFLLAGWPFAGIQSDDTMRSILRRHAERARSRAAEPPLS